MWAEYILSQKGQEVLAKYGFSAPSTSVPEHQGAGGILLAVGVAFILNKKQVLLKKQLIKIVNKDAEQGRHNLFE